MSHAHHVTYSFLSLTLSFTEIKENPKNSEILTNSRIHQSTSIHLEMLNIHKSKP